MAFQLPPLPYDYNALEPYIDEMTMRIHHDKHHAAYVTNANAALETNATLQAKSVEDLLRNIESVPEAIRTAIRNNAGGHANHTLFWEIMTPGGAKEPTGALAQDMNAAFGSFDAFKEQFTQKATTLFGSGWTWLCEMDGKLSIANYANGDSPLRDGANGLLTCDVWEHAYYIDYRNARPKYVEGFWKLANWDFAAQRMSEPSTVAMAGI
jgi:Fe-Mn family superoxide dismutase